MSYPRQNRAYNVGIHDPMWVLPNNYFVDGVDNGITDGTGGVVYLSGYEGANNQIINDESRFALASTIAVGDGIQVTTSPLSGDKCWKPSLNLNRVAGVPSAGAGHLKMCITPTFVTAFTYEFYFRREGPVTANTDVQLGGLWQSSTQYYCIRVNVSTSASLTIIQNFSAMWNSPIGYLADLNWHHFCMENKVPGNSPRTVNFYFDGVLATNLVLSFNNATPATYQMYHSNSMNAPAGYFMDEVRLTKGAYRYGGPFTPNPPVGGSSGGGANFIRG